MNADEKSPLHTALLDAADGLIRAEGADGWSLADLAARAGVPVESAEGEFDDEGDAFRQVIRRDEKRYESAALRPRRTSPSERVLALLEAFVPEYDWTYWIELWSLALRDERAVELQIELDERFRDVIEDIVRDGVE